MRLNPKKRPLALVDIVRRVLDRLGRDYPLKLRIVGDGPQRAALERAITRAGLTGHIELLGRIPREEIRALFGGTHIFVLPTIRESFGLAALEARCAGVPVVAMAASGVAEIIESGREGLLARSDDEMADHIVSLAGDRARLERIRCHNLQTTAPHDWATVIGAHLNAYRDAITLRDNVWADTKK